MYSFLGVAMSSATRSVLGKMTEMFQITQKFNLEKNA
jgi:hypothetical protein